MKKRRYPLVVSSMVSSAWLLQREKLDVLRALALKWSGLDGPVVYWDDDDDDDDCDPEDEDSKILSGIAVLSIRGVICHRAGMLERMSGMTSAQWIGEQMKAFASNSAVSQIIVDFDTPGGSVEGLPECADVIYSLRGSKPIIGIANANALSAGWWLLSACSKRYVTPSGLVGSQGVYMMHVDYSKQNEMIGIDPTYISAGEYKVEGNSDEPLGDEARAYLQKQCDRIYSKFVETVARNLGRSAQEVAENFGKGRCLQAEDALRVGMVDGIVSYDELIEKTVGSTPSRATGRSVSMLKRRLGLQRRR